MLRTPQGQDLGPSGPVPRWHPGLRAPARRKRRPHRPGRAAAPAQRLCSRHSVESEQTTLLNLACSPALEVWPSRGFFALVECWLCTPTRSSRRSHRPPAASPPSLHVRRVRRSARCTARKSRFQRPGSVVSPRFSPRSARPRRTPLLLAVFGSLYCCTGLGTWTPTDPFLFLGKRFVRADSSSVRRNSVELTFRLPWTYLEAEQLS
mmetsp:Transcript_9202/g.15693  ORF Transcript_9202/g.15693 Transcript_9202/m.15693 type:complete len:207 (-) Transcript_9202:60-680(-)